MGYRKIRALGKHGHHSLWEGPNGWYLCDSMHPAGGAQGPLQIDLGREASIGLNGVAIPVFVARTGSRAACAIDHRAYCDLMEIVALPTRVTEGAAELFAALAAGNYKPDL